MFQNYSKLVQNTITDAAITTHLLNHRSRPTVAFTLAGLNQLRCRGRSDGVRQLLAQAQAWAAPLNLAPLDPLEVATTLARVLWFAAEHTSHQADLTPTTRNAIASNLPDLPVASLTRWAEVTGLGRQTTKRAMVRLDHSGVLELLLVRGDYWAVASGYRDFICSLLPAQLVNGVLVTRHQPKRYSSGIQTGDSPFDVFYDPHGYRVNPPKASVR